MDDSNVDVDGVLVHIPIKVAKNKKFKKLLNRKASAKKNCSNERDLLELQRSM